MPQISTNNKSTHSRKSLQSLNPCVNVQNLKLQLTKGSHLSSAVNELALKLLNSMSTRAFKLAQTLEGGDKSFLPKNTNPIKMNLNRKQLTRCSGGTCLSPFFDGRQTCSISLLTTCSLLLQRWQQASSVNIIVTSIQIIVDDCNRIFRRSDNAENK